MAGSGRNRTGAGRTLVIDASEEAYAASKPVEGRVCSGFVCLGDSERGGEGRKVLKN